MCKCTFSCSIKHAKLQELSTFVAADHAMCSECRPRCLTSAHNAGTWLLEPYHTCHSQNFIWTLWPFKLTHNTCTLHCRCTAHNLQSTALWLCMGGDYQAVPGTRLAVYGCKGAGTPGGCPNVLSPSSHFHTYQADVSATRVSASSRAMPPAAAVPAPAEGGAALEGCSSVLAV